MYTVATNDGVLCSDLAVLGVGDTIKATQSLVINLTAKRVLPKNTPKNLNEMRGNLCKKVGLALCKMPPCEDAFKQHFFLE